ncbi:hypothetical protein L593_13595 [Salinarchaeum sp. Harcht-Bsk1]|uniref:DUF7288 family protein n=1 Tax=Salinarchaeum sp. Harcht-Bsk1 TaxID=1333523 RepID=UPI0003423173|nr:hypothetical protein [Salinarchaeum sp. Harcht-Bsk1]AGN02658.1 hypothetical protein L593_13595 [Salinarchaeum sp. Harcht-Bsk1]
MAGSGDRGQAYTLESLIAALLLVTAVLFALQSVVITPTSAGALDRDVQGQLEQEANDVLVTAANEGELSRLARYWDCSTGTMASDMQSGAWVPNQGYANDVAPVEDLGESLNRTFGEGTRYNLLLVYDTGSGQNVTRVIYQGTPGDEVVSTSYTITLTESQQITAANAAGQSVAGCGDPVIERHPGSTGATWNVVEVRLVLW